MAKKTAALIGDEISAPELASLCGITERRVQQLAAEGVFEKLGHGKYRRAGAGGSYADYRVKSEMDRRSDGATARDSFDVERTRRLKIQNDRDEGRLVDTDDAVDAIDMILGPVKTELLSIPARMTKDVALRRQWEDGINEVLKALAGRQTEAFEDLRSGSADADADGADDA